MPKECTYEPVGENRGRQAGDGEVSDKSYGKRIKLPVDSIPKAQAWLPDGALVSGVRNWGCKRAGRVNSPVARDAKMEIPVEIRYIP